MSYFNTNNSTEFENFLVEKRIPMQIQLQKSQQQPQQQINNITRKTSSQPVVASNTQIPNSQTLSTQNIVPSNTVQNIRQISYIPNSSSQVMPANISTTFSIVPFLPGYALPYSPQVILPAQLAQEKQNIKPLTEKEKKLEKYRQKREKRKWDRPVDVKRSKVAQTRSRDEHGHFISEVEKVKRQLLEVQARLSKNETVNKALKETLNAKTLELEQLQRQSSPTPHPDQDSSTTPEPTQGTSHNDYNLEQHHYLSQENQLLIIDSRANESIVYEEPNLRLLIDNALSSSPPKESNEVLHQFEEKIETGVLVNSATNKKSPAIS